MVPPAKACEHQLIFGVFIFSKHRKKKLVSSKKMEQKQGYKDLIVWQKSIHLVKLVYKVCDQMPKSEQFILISQMLRCSISIPSNIAEGWSRNRKLEFIRFLEIAYASSCELETQLIIAKDRYFTISYDEIFSLLTEIQKMLSKLISNKINSDS
jgi:four helix bundle protein